MSAHEPRYSDHHAPPRYIDSAAAGPARKTARVARRWRICERRIESYVARNSRHIARRSAQHLIFRVIQPTRPTPWRAALASVPGCGVRDAFRTTTRHPHTTAAGVSRCAHARTVKISRSSRCNTVPYDHAYGSLRAEYTHVGRQDRRAWPWRCLVQTSMPIHHFPFMMARTSLRLPEQPGRRM